MEHTKLQKTSAAGIDQGEFVFHKVIAVRSLEGYCLEIAFEGGLKKKYDIKPLFTKWDSFSVLRDVPGLFEYVKIEPGGYAISWNDEIDLSCEELWNSGTFIIT